MDTITPTNVSTVTITDNEVASALSIADSSGMEGNSANGSIEFTVTLDPANTTQTVTVQYDVAGSLSDTAKIGYAHPTIPDTFFPANRDVLNSSGTLTFMPTETEKNITVTTYC